MAEYGRIGLAGDYVDQGWPPKANTGMPQSEIGIRRIADTVGNLSPAKLDVKIYIEYDASNEFSPFKYSIDFPDDMKVFFYESGMTDAISESYYGNGISYVTAVDAKRRGETEAKIVAKRYKKYLDDKLQAESYVYSIDL